MGKIIPTIIYNMQEKYELDKKPGGSSSTVQQSKPYVTAEDLANFAQDCLRDICSRTGYANVRSVIQPALQHLDQHSLWLPPGGFSRTCISTICYALPRQYAYKAVQILVAHLDNHIEDEAPVRTSIIRCLEATVEIASSVGPSVFEVFDALLRHLRRSTMVIVISDAERNFQEALVNAIGEFAKNLPHFQKVEVMQLILDKARDAAIQTRIEGKKGSENYEMQYMLLESLLKVSLHYEPRQMSVSFPSALMDLLLPLAMSESNHVRTLVHKVGFGYSQPI